MLLLSGALVILVMAVGSLAGVITLTAKEQVDYPPTLWPLVVPPTEELRTRQVPNADRLKRGLPPRAPARLYDPSRVHSAPQARISPTPPASIDGYTFQGCYGVTSRGDPDILKISAVSSTDAATQCAAWAQPNSYADFIVFTNGGGPSEGTLTYYCMSDVTGDETTPQPCTLYNYGWYSAES